MKKYIRLFLTACLAFCMVLCLGLAVACQPTTDDANTFTLTILDEDGKPVEKPAVGNLLQYCAEDAQCHLANPDSDGKVIVDISTDEWKNSPTMHIEVFAKFVSEGYKVYDEDGKVCAYNETDKAYEVYVNHHEVKSYTLTIKEESVVEPEAIEVGYQYNADNLVSGVSKTFTTIVDRTSNAAFFDVDVHGGEFELSALIGDSEEPLVETLDAENNSVYLELNPSTYGTSVELTITPKTAASTELTFALCPAYEFVNGEVVLNAYTTAERPLDVYKAYIFLTGDEELALVNDADYDCGGFPITVTVGAADPVTWTEAANVPAISTPSGRGYTPFTFEFDKPESANLYVHVKDLNAASDTTLTVNVPATITLDGNSDEGLNYTFTVPADGSYYIVVENATNAVVSFIVNDLYYSEFYSASKNGNSLAIVISYTEKEYGNGWLEPPTNIIEHTTLNTDDVITIIFNTENTSGDSYSAVIKDSADGLTLSKSDDELAPEYIWLEEQFGGELEAGDVKTYLLTVNEYDPTKLTLSIDDISGEFELSYKIGDNEVQTKTVTATESIELDLSNEEIGWEGLEIVITLKTTNGGTIHLTLSEAE